MLETLWLFFILLLTTGALILQLLILNSLVDFEIDHVNPLDLCSTLEKRISPILIIHAVSSFFCILCIKISWPVLLINAGIAAAIFFIKRKKSRIFEPMTIVRDLKQIKGRHIIFVVGCCLSFIYSFVQMLLSAFSK